MRWLLQGPLWRRIVCWFVVVVSALWLFSKVFWENTVLDLPEMAATLYARENCSCLFVIGQSEESCREITKQFVPLSSITIDREKRTVQTRVFWGIARAKWVSDRLGCQIEN